MKIQNKLWLAVLCILAASMWPLGAQEMKENSLRGSLVEPYKIEVAYYKTTHMLFPSAIRYVDLGSDLLIAGKAEEVSNVLRIKSSVMGFQEQINLSVITEDGNFYSFEVAYNPYPDIVNYNLVKLERVREKKQATDLLFEELGEASAEHTELLLKSLYAYSGRTFTHLGSKSFGIQGILRGLYSDEGRFYFILQLKNSSSVSFEIDSVRFTITDKKNLKRTIVQNKVLLPVRVYPEVIRIGGQSENKIIYILDLFTLSEGAGSGNRIF